MVKDSCGTRKILWVKNKMKETQKHVWKNLFVWIFVFVTLRFEELMEKVSVEKIRGITEHFVTLKLDKEISKEKDNCGFF